MITHKLNVERQRERRAWVSTFHGLAAAVSGCWLLTSAATAADSLEDGFRQPPASSRPWVYWFPLDGNISSNGITADLEAMKRVGIGGVLYMETEQGTPPGPAKFAGPLWRNLFKHLVAEADRLGIQINVNNDAGWCGSGGPWITPELSMQRIVWTETNVTGPRRFEAELAQPTAVRSFYQDIAVFAFPTPASDYSIARRVGKTGEGTQEIPLRTTYPVLPADSTIARDRVLMLTGDAVRNGRVNWEVPAGKWTLLRVGHTTTGKDNHPAPIDGRGLECDKLSKQAAEAAFNGLMGKLIDDSRSRVGEDRTMVSTHIDSWEVGSQNWTPKFREEFQRRRGYDPMPFLPVMTGRVVDNLEVSERFLWDVRMTISDLLIDNYAGRFQELARQHGIRLSIEAYGEPADDLTYAGRADEPMAEFWSWDKFGAAYSCTEMASAAHVYGRRILGAEAFTASDGERWQGHPAAIKDLGDWAFCEGINRFVFHRYALQPWTNPDHAPGISMGPWGLHYERTQTWWEQSRPWHEYLARCQFLLQQGLFVADLCFLAPERSPQAFKSPVKSGFDRPGYNFDGCPPEVVLTRMSVKDGRLVLPDGMNYRLLVLPDVPTMTPKLLRRIKELVSAGATIVGAPPAKSPSLSDFPQCDAEVKALATEMWGTEAAPAELTARPFGKGRIFWGGAIRPKEASVPELVNPFGSARWIWRKEGNPAASAPAGVRFFRRNVVLEADGAVASAQFLMTADNAFDCRINDRSAGSGDTWGRVYDMDIKSLLKPGANLITVTATNTGDTPSPAGLIGMLKVKYASGRTVDVPTDARWETCESDVAPAGGWAGATELGALGMEPWGDIQGATPGEDPTPDAKILGGLLGALGVPPDFSSQCRHSPQSLRYIHKVINGNDVYFVANKNPQPEDAVCTFRVRGRRPELWWPDTGRIERPAVYDESLGCTRVPVHLDPSGSVFVIFRDQAPTESNRVVKIRRNAGTIMDLAGKETGVAAIGAPPAKTIDLSRQPGGKLEATVWQPGKYEVGAVDGKTARFEVAALPLPLAITGPWDLTFPPNWGAPPRVALDKLISWSEHPDAGVRYFSGTATYRKTFNVPPDTLTPDRRQYLDLGQVAVMAEVKLNGKDLGILWKPPYCVEVTSALNAGDNVLEIKVVNLWINRLIGDEQLPEDSDRNPNGTLKSWPQWVLDGKPSPAGRYTFTSWRLWKKTDALVSSGLLGPVAIQAAQRIALDEP
jgi:hypothetical protein